jgi:tubulin-folding cofactor B
MADVPLQVISENAASERRITPSWSISTLKTKLEPITGVPPSAQKLSLKTSGGSDAIPVEAADEDNTRLSSFPLAPYAELHVSVFLVTAFHLFIRQHVQGPGHEYEVRRNNTETWSEAQDKGHV